MAKFRHQGFTIDWTPALVAIDSGQAVPLVDEAVGIAAYDIAAGELGALHVEGVFLCTKANPTDTFVRGARVDINTAVGATNSQIAGSATGKHVVVGTESGGTAVAATDAAALVKINVFL